MEEKKNNLDWQALLGTTSILTYFVARICRKRELLPAKVCNGMELVSLASGSAAVAPKVYTKLRESEILDKGASLIVGDAGKLVRNPNSELVITKIR